MFSPCNDMNSSKSPSLPQGEGDIAQKWQQLMGQDHWDGLLDPLDIDLRRTIVHYGEMAQATYDTFIRDKYSKSKGLSRFSRKGFFAKLGLELGRPYKYKVTKFLYATSKIEVAEAFILFRESNFMGYVAVADDESVKLLGRREIVVAWRGTVQWLEWAKDLEFFKVPAPEIVGCVEPKAEVHEGWHSIYTSKDPKSQFSQTSAREQVLTELRRLVEKYKDEEISITVTGHSLGAALATMNAIDIVANIVNQPKQSSPNTKPCLVTAVLFASPPVGDENFKNMFSQHDNLRVLRVHNIQDIVPNLLFIGYSNVGEELKIDTTQSKYLKEPKARPICHYLVVYIHGVASTQGSKEGFKLEVDEQHYIAFINKPGDILKDEYLVPANWWVLKNKGMSQQDDGSWLLKDHETDEDDD